jgi:MFS-type transporter involved in bile tolerance (Atg22 family)
MATDTVNSGLSPPNRCRLQLYSNNKEALGFALDGVARIVGFIAAAVFLSTAIINLAKQDAGCIIYATDNEQIVPECNARVYGLRPSSLLTTYGTIVGLISAFSLPIVGAVVDYTPHRKLIGFVSAALQLCFIFVQIFLTKSNWFPMTIVQVGSAFVGWMHTLVVFAYLPELTEDENLLVSWTASFHILQYCTLIAFLLYMLGILYVTGYTNDGDEILSSRIASISSLIIAAPCYFLTWTRLMKRRRSFHQLPQDSSLLTIGFVKVYRTSKMMYHRFRSLLWFFLNVSLVEAGQQSIAAISLTFMTDTLQMTATENGIAILMLFIFGIVGAAIGKISVKFVNPIASNQICQILTGLNTGMAALILYGPGQQIRAYIVASIWGLGAGWKNTIERFTITQIIPKGQDTELMGFYLFASQILVWAPTLLFTILNEVGVNPRLSLLVLVVFFAGALFSLWMVGPYEVVVRVAREHEHHNDVRADINDEQNDDGSLIATPSQQTDDKIEDKN